MNEGINSNYNAFRHAWNGCIKYILYYYSCFMVMFHIDTRGNVLYWIHAVIVPSHIKLCHITVYIQY